MAAAPALASVSWVGFVLGDRRCALPLDSVTRIVRAAELTPLPLAPEVVAGAVDFHGRILPVFDPRRRFELPTHDLRTTDEFIFARTSRRELGLWVDTSLGVLDGANASFVPAHDLEPSLRHLGGVVSMPDGMVLIHDLEHFLFAEEERALDAALTAARTSHAG